MSVALSAVDVDINMCDVSRKNVGRNSVRKWVIFDPMAKGLNYFRWTNGPLKV